MQVELERHNQSLYVIETSTKGVICHLPNIMVRKDIGPLLKALSILLKGMSVEIRKRRFQTPTPKKS